MANPAIEWHPEPVTIYVICSAGCDAARVHGYGDSYQISDEPKCGNCEAPMREATTEEIAAQA